MKIKLKPVEYSFMGILLKRKKNWTRSGVDLWVCVQVSDALDIDDDQLVTWTFKGQVTEGLRCLAVRFVVQHKTRIRIVLDVFTLNRIKREYV